MPSAIVVLTAVTIIAASHYLYVPYPEHASQPWHKSATAAVDRIQRIMMQLGDRSGIVSEVTVRRIFTFLTSTYSPTANGIETTRMTIAGVPVLRHKPTSLKGEGHPALIYIHGGGWISGSAESYRGLTSHISSEGSLIVFSVSYRLAPEHIFPAGHDDCLTVTRTILQKAKDFGLDPERIGIAGDEVGGTIALSVALTFREDPNTPDVCMTGVFYAPLQSVDFHLPSYLTYDTGPASLQRNDVMNNLMYYVFGEKRRDVKEHMIKNLHTPKFFWQTDLSKRLDMNWLPFSFRNTKPETKPFDSGNQTLIRDLQKVLLDPRLSPMFASDESLSELRHLYFISPDIDPLRDESFMLYEFIREINMMNLDHMYYPSENHGFLHDFLLNDVAQEAIKEFVHKFAQVCMGS